MSKRLTGLHPLAYLGVEAATPPQMYLAQRAPTTSDAKNFNLGDMWLDEPNESLYVLVSLSQGVGTWVTTFGGAANAFVTDSGTAVDVGGVINLLGDGDIQTSATGNTITLTLDGDPLELENLKLNDQIEGVLFTDSTGLVSAVNGTNGQIIIGGGTEPQWGSITSDGSIVITAGANTLQLTAPNASGLTDIDGDTGTATQAAGTINIVGDGATIETDGSGDTLTVSLIPGNDGQLIIGATAGAPLWANLASAGGTVVITEGANTINLEATGGGSSGASTFITDSGNALQNLGDIDILGGNNIATSGAGQSVTIDLNGTTNHAVQVGNASGSLTSVTVGTDGQVLIGATGADPEFSTLTSVDGSIIFTPGAGTLDLSAVSGGGGGMVVTQYSTPGSFTWTKNAATKYVEVWGWCAGGGGGSGQAAGGGTSRQGGAGGGSGSFFRFKAPSMFFGATEPVEVGAGGSGAAGTSSGQGNDGTDGGVSSFGDIIPPLTVANFLPGATQTTLPQAGNGGGGFKQIGLGTCSNGGGVFCDDAGMGYRINGTTQQGFSAPVAGFSDTNVTPASNGGKGSFTVGTDGLYVGGDGILPGRRPTFPFIFMLGTSGAQGGSIDSSNVAYNGGTGGNIYALDGTTILNAGGTFGVQSGATDGGNGNDKPTSGGLVFGGTGGGGGAAHPTNPGDGGDGGFPGGGGGGGGATNTGVTSGAGGDGADGFVMVIEWT